MSGPWRENEGDCDSDEDCFEDLVCGSNNCQSNFPHDADCCYDAGKGKYFPKIKSEYQA